MKRKKTLFGLSAFKPAASEEDEKPTYEVMPWCLAND